MRLVGSTHWTDLRGPTACVLLTEDEADAVRARLDRTRCVTTLTRTARGPASSGPGPRWPPY